jgi:hypothetical protein
MRSTRQIHHKKSDIHEVTELIVRVPMGLRLANPCPLRYGHDIYTIGVAEEIEYTYFVESHDVTTPDGADLGSEILFNGASFAIPIYTPYTFGAEGNYAIQAGTYSVVHADYDTWTPVSHVITNVEQNDTTNFLGIRYILHVTSTPVAQSIFRDGGDTGVLTNSSLYNSDVDNLLGTYTLEDAPFGFVWVPVLHTVTAADFNAGNDYTYTIDFVLAPDPTLPVELSSFTGTITAQNFVKLTWISESETNLLGYRVYRNTVMEQATAMSITPIMVSATNTSSTHVYSLTDNEVSLNTTYYYWLESIDFTETNFYGPVSVYVEGEVPPVLPHVTTMSNAYPNPFRRNSSTSIDVSVKGGESGNVTIYNVLGQVVKTYKVTEGINQIVWNGMDNAGNVCGSGIYFYKLSTPSINTTKKMVVIR